MLRKKLVDFLIGYITFMKRHLVLGFGLTALLLAACAAGLYLLALQVPTLLSMPCFTGGCGG